MVHSQTVVWFGGVLALAWGGGEGATMEQRVLDPISGFSAIFGSALFHGGTRMFTETRISLNFLILHRKVHAISPHANGPMDKATLIGTG